MHEDVEQARVGDVFCEIMKLIYFLYQCRVEEYRMNQDLLSFVLLMFGPQRVGVSLCMVCTRSTVVTCTCAAGDF